MEIAIGFWYLTDWGQLEFSKELMPSQALTCRYSWHVDPVDPDKVWFFVVGALVLCADDRQVYELVTRWKLQNDDAVAFAERHNMRLMASGGRWYASLQKVNPDQRFEGATALDALVALSRSLYEANPGRPFLKHHAARAQ